ncbi:zinc transporter ZIP13-like [Polyodon spathula]|uniref:zinc transporter ZIP13-like n=1 Tax=Polyodon spathula TaxID=7913 RepID=UPI001B7E11C1|nr:zinc transporter ZIP13-like [Polyodon spathula]XP_041074722.1 zinc transporter ZIP13-like [Polyodon spathula]XP_041074723.1 zinc transporter ZIP13-like [Polyodon spathula]
MKGPRLALCLNLSVAALLLPLTWSHRSSAKKMPQAAVVQAAAGTRWWCAEELLSFGALSELFVGERVDAWVCSLIGSVMVGLSGIFPLLVIPIEAGAVLKTEGGSQKLKQLLSFAIGGLLGDVFLHLLPEAWAYSCSSSGTVGSHSHQQHKSMGLWVIAGLLTFLVLEKMFPDREREEEDESPSCTEADARFHNGACAGQIITLKDKTRHSNGYCNNSAKKPKTMLHQTTENIKTSGYLNLLANCIDNFTHGLAVGGSFLVSRKVGFLTTLAILLHEIPHEVGDFAILLRAGFDRWSAAKMQLSTAFGGVLGAGFALYAQSPKGAEGTTSWILPFTSGGFLYIALVNVVPDLLDETNLRQSVLQVLLMCSGIAVMVIMSAIIE